MPRDPRVGIGVASIILKGDPQGGPPRVLLGRRCGTLMPNTWALPGGWHDAGEQPLETAIRELKEETGMDIHRFEFSLVAVFSHELPTIDTWCATVYYLAYADHQQEPQVMEPDKVSEWRWFLPKDVPTDLMASTEDALRTHFGVWWRAD